ncbi:MAG: hypothetical protein ACPGOY_14410 [Rhodospirillaceae bacterium]
MLGMDDCIGFSGLDAEQIDQLSAKLHRPAVIIAEWAETISELPGGEELIEEILHHPGTATESDLCQRFLDHLSESK